MVKPRAPIKLKFHYTAIGHGSGIVRYIKLDDFHKNFFVTEPMGVYTNMREIWSIDLSIDVNHA